MGCKIPCDIGQEPGTKAALCDVLGSIDTVGHLFLVADSFFAKQYMAQNVQVTHCGDQQYHAFLDNLRINACYPKLFFLISRTHEHPG